MNNTRKGRGDFLKVYSNLPMDIRREIICIIDEKPVTWNVAFEEIEKNTKLSLRILDKIIDMGLI